MARLIFGGQKTSADKKQEIRAGVKPAHSAPEPL